MSGLHYKITLADLAGHYLQVRLTFTPVDNQPVQLSMPAWIPGSYMVRDFARNLLNIAAHDEEGLLPLVQLDKQSWQLQPRQTPVTVEYQLYAFDLSVRANYLSADIAVVNPAASCLSVSSHLVTPVQLSVAAGTAPANWQLACALPRIGEQAITAFGTFQAVNYAELIDSPLMAGDLSVREFTVNNIAHYLVLCGEKHTDIERITADLLPLCQQQVAVFGAMPADLNQYWFLTWVVDEGYGGLEHRASTLLLCNRFDLPNPQQPDVFSDAYQNFLALCSHEYFHTWWVKRARPRDYLHYQLSGEQYSTQLWLYEGFTSYYDDLSLLRAGKMTLPQYLQQMAKTISRLQRAPANLRQSLADSSFNAWTRFYRQDENAVNAVVSYYTKGALLAWCLDAQLQHRQLSLDGLMQLCWREFGSNETGSTETQFLALLLSYCHDKNLVLQCQRWITEAVELPLAESLALIGLELSWRVPAHQNDLTGPADNSLLLDTGLHFEAKNDGLSVSAVRNNSAAHLAGLSKGDVIIAVAGLKASDTTWREVLARHASGTELLLHYFRQQQLQQTKLILNEPSATVAMLSASQQLTSWPGINWTQPKADKV